MNLAVYSNWKAPNMEWIYSMASRTLCTWCQKKKKIDSQKWLYCTSVIIGMVEGIMSWHSMPPWFGHHLSLLQKYAIRSLPAVHRKWWSALMFWQPPDGWHLHGRNNCEVFQACWCSRYSCWGQKLAIECRWWMTLLEILMKTLLIVALLKNTSKI